MKITALKLVLAVAGMCFTVQVSAFGTWSLLLDIGDMEDLRQESRRAGAFFAKEEYLEPPLAQRACGLLAQAGMKVHAGGSKNLLNFVKERSEWDLHPLANNFGGPYMERTKSVIDDVLELSFILRNSGLSADVRAQIYTDCVENYAGTWRNMFSK